jgi:tRNA(Ile)-lysidine synthase
VLVALSGGPDSVALFHLLRELDADGELALIGAAHFNHQLRDSADGDEAFCRDLAAHAGYDLVADRGDVRATAARDRRSLEDAARTARHAFLERARRQTGADVIALGHTKDDQAETFLLRLIRGAGARGLASMHPKNGALIRPLIDCRRAELQTYLGRRGAAWMRDETNDDVSIPRNRLRAELLPLLERRFNPSVVEALADAAEIARGDWTWLVDEASRWTARAVRHAGHRVTLDCAVLADAPEAVARVVVRDALLVAGDGRPVPFEAVERARELMQGNERGAFHLPGQIVERIGSHVVLTGRPRSATGRPRRVERSLFHYPLSIPGEVRLPESGLIVSAEPAGQTADANPGNSGLTAAVRLDQCRGALAVRNRRPGDRFRPEGVGGGKKLQDFFVDRKIAGEERDRIPIVVDAADRIVWVAGHAISEEFRVTDSAQAVLILRLKAVGGPV